MPRADMERFWDERARENAAYYVDDRMDWGEADLDAFFRAGARDLDALLEALDVAIGPGDDVVEVGCGIGRLTRELARRARSVRALDVSTEMLARARECNPALDGVTWIHGDGRTLTGVRDRSADAVVSHVVFQHIPDPDVTLGYVRDMGRVLRPGGWAAFQISNDPEVHRRRRGPRALAWRLRGAIGRGPRGGTHPAWLGSAVDLDELGAAASGAALDVERVVGAGTQFCLVRLRRRDGT